MKLTSKLALGILVLLCFTLSLGGGWTIQQNLHHALRRAESESTALHLQQRSALEQALRQNQAEDVLGAAAVGDAYSRQLQSAIAAQSPSFSLLTANGTVVYPCMDDTISLADQLAAIQAGTDSIYHQSGGGEYHLLLASPLQCQIQGLWVVTAWDVTALYSEQNRQLVQYFWLECLALALTGLAAAGFARLVTRPLRELERTAGQIAAGAFHRRVQVRGQDEIAELAGSFNAMADAIQQQITALEQQAQRQNRFVAAFTHELKTPMTSILGYSDLLRLGEQSPLCRQQAADFIYHEARRLELLSHRLLRLLQVQQGGLQLEAVPVAGIFRDACRSLPADFPVQVETHCDPAALIRADRPLLADLVRNLLLNAAAAGPRDGVVRLCCSRQHQGWCISVSDKGRGIPADALDKITEPFYMVDKSRSRQRGGSGLGLSLCDEIARAHGSRLEFESRVGIGTTVRLFVQEAKE